MKRHLCIWLRSWPNHAHADDQRIAAALESIATDIQQQICPLVAIDHTPHTLATGDSGHLHPQPSLLCDITGVVHLFDGEAGLLAATEQRLADAGISFSLSIADTVGAAWAIAHHGDQSVVARGRQRQAIGSLPVQALRIAPETVGTLARLGVYQIDALLQLPRSGLAPRLGTQLVRRIEQALGEVDEPINVYRPATEHVADHDLDYPTHDHQILIDRIRGLVTEVRAGLATCHRGALRLTCRLDLVAHPPLTLDVGLFAASIDADHLAGLIINRLEAIRLPSDVQRLTLAVPFTGSLRSDPVNLFDKNSDSNHGTAPKIINSEISRLVDSLSGRLGCDAVVGVGMKANPLPEKSFAVESLTGKRRFNIRSRQSQKSSAEVTTADSKSSLFPAPEDPMRRPFSLLSKPIPIAVSHHGQPFCFSAPTSILPDRIRLDGTIHSIVRSWGSERIETGWWNGPSIRRDYYRIETDSADWWWIFRNLSTNADQYQWMLHGRFH